MAGEKNFENRLKKWLESEGIYPLGEPVDRMSAWSQSICALKILRCTSTPSVSKRRSSLARYTGRQSSVGTTATLRDSESMRCNSSCRSLSMRFFASYELPQETTVKTANM